MKSIAQYENLETKKHLIGDGYEVGELTNVASYQLLQKGWSLLDGELCGRFNGVRTFVDFLQTNHKKFGTRKPKDDDSSRRVEYGDRWVKFSTYDECLNEIRNKPETFRHFTEADIRIREWEANGNDADFDVTGDFIDIGRALSGEPECFGTMRNGIQTKRFANIVVNGNHACRVDQDWIDHKAERVTRLVDFFEANNVRVNLTIVFSNNNSHLEIVVKQYNDVLDINDVAIALSADFFRRFEFHFSEHSKRHTSNYGRAENLHLQNIKDDDVDLNILVNSDDRMHPTLCDIDKAFDYVEQRISTEGVKHGDEYAILA